MSKILSKIGKKKRIAGKRNRWGKKKQNRLRPKDNNNYEKHTACESPKYNIN